MATNSGATLDIVTDGLGACLATRRLHVPKYQRAFSWDLDHVNDFLSDIYSAYSEAATEYFMGSVVLQGSGKRFEVVDGQQRLTCATIVIVSACDLLRDRGHPDVAISLQTAFLFDKDKWSQSIAPKLELSVYDNEFFVDCILGGAELSPKRESHYRLLSAKKRAWQFLNGIAEAHAANWFERIKGFVNYLESSARIIQVIVPTEANAYVIFETLNDRGKDLSASDLLKNYLFRRADDRIEEVQANWNKMLGVLEPFGGDDLVITYIRQLWAATRELVRERDLFAKMRAAIVAPQQAVAFSSELVEQAHHFTAIISPNHPIWKQLGADASAAVTALNDIQIERYRPALLAALKHLPATELVGALKIMLNASVRYVISIGAGGGAIEAAWSDAARKITSKHVATATQLALEMAKIIPNDAVFRQSFENARISKGYISRYLLSALEQHVRGAAGGELIPSADVAQLNLEHVLPEHPGPGWEHIPPEMAAAFARRLGNQVLLASKVNSKIGNQGFTAKRPYLAASEIKLTKALGDATEWGPTQIAQRQKELSELAVKVWKI